MSRTARPTHGTNRMCDMLGCTAMSRARPPPIEEEIAHRSTLVEPARGSILEISRTISQDGSLSALSFCSVERNCCFETGASGLPSTNVGIVRKREAWSIGSVRAATWYSRLVSPLSSISKILICLMCLRNSKASGPRRRNESTKPSTSSAV